MYKMYIFNRVEILLCKIEFLIRRIEILLHRIEILLRREYFPGGGSAIVKNLTNSRNPSPVILHKKNRSNFVHYVNRQFALQDVIYNYPKRLDIDK